MFDIHIEWDDAPGVRDPLLATTWARLEFRLDGEPMTKYWSTRARSLRDGVYGSALPLAEWIVNNWWSLLYEGLRLSPAHISARTRRAEARGWLQRHNLFLCREGMAYPDLTIFRSEDEIVLRWFSDPATTTTQGRFLDEGVASVGLSSMEAALETLVESVLERARGVQDEALEPLSELWTAISESRRDANEAKICQRLAMLGQDPYAESMYEALEAAVEQLSLSTGVVQDLLAASTPSALADDATTARRLLDGLPPISKSHASRKLAFVPGARGELLPYRAGYARASEVRKYLGLSDEEPLRDLEGVIARVMGGELTHARPTRGRADVEAAVQSNGVAAISSDERSKSNERFLLGRALHHWLYVTTEVAPQRLLTKGHDWLQASSRAFSAELLAPARALSKRLAGRADWERQDELADEFEVTRMVIAHQIDNHGLA